MPVTVSSSFLSYLRTFLAPNRCRSKRRHCVSRINRVRDILRTQRSALRAQRFVFETLEERLLLSGTPTQVITLDVPTIQDSYLLSTSASTGPRRF
jgi:hypothetical protein